MENRLNRVLSDLNIFFKALKKMPWGFDGSRGTHLRQWWYCVVGAWNHNRSCLGSFLTPCSLFMGSLSPSLQKRSLNTHSVLTRSCSIPLLQSLKLSRFLGVLWQGTNISVYNFIFYWYHKVLSDGYWDLILFSHVTSFPKRYLLLGE